MSAPVCAVCGRPIAPGAETRIYRGLPAHMVCPPASWETPCVDGDGRRIPPTSHNGERLAYAGQQQTYPHRDVYVDASGCRYVCTVVQTMVVRNRSLESEDGWRGGTDIQWVRGAAWAVRPE